MDEKKPEGCEVSRGGLLLSAVHPISVESVKTVPTRNISLDYGKAVAVLFVLLWHEHIFGRGSMFDISAKSPVIPSVTDVLYANVLLQAVPFFIFLSCYLYATGVPTWATLRKRTAKLSVLHLFWGFTYFLVVGGVPSLLGAFDSIQERPLYAVLTAMGSYYFFSALLVATVLTHFATALRTRTLVGILIVSTIMIIAMQVSAIFFQVGWTTVFWSPLNYIAVPPAAILLYRHLNGEKPRLKLIGILSALFLATAIAEWAYVASPTLTANQGYAIPAYTRLSLLFFSCAALCALLRIELPANPIVAFGAKYSLSIYCLQAFVLGWTAGLPVSVWIKFAIDLAITSTLAYILHKFIFKDGLLATEPGQRSSIARQV